MELKTNIMSGKKDSFDLSVSQKTQEKIKKLEEYFKYKDILKKQLLKKLKEDVDLDDPAEMKKYILSLRVFIDPVSKI